MDMQDLELAVFDMAGTTVQAADHVPAAFRDAFDGAGVTLEDEEIRSVRGKSKREAVAGLLASHRGAPAAPADVERVYGEFQRLLTERYQGDGVAPVPGAGETFAWLRARGVKVALSTGFDRALVDLLLGQVGWEGEVDAVVCNEDVPRGRPAPYLLFRAMEWCGCESVHRVAAVGDTVPDLEAAANAGVRWAVGVLSGAHSAAQLEACPHSAIIESVAAFPGLFSGE